MTAKKVSNYYEKMFFYDFIRRKLNIGGKFVTVTDNFFYENKRFYFFQKIFKLLQIKQIL